MVTQIQAVEDLAAHACTQYELHRYWCDPDMELPQTVLDLFKDLHFIKAWISALSVEEQNGCLAGDASCQHIFWLLDPPYYCNKYDTRKAFIAGIRSSQLDDAALDSLYKKLKDYAPSFFKTFSDEVMPSSQSPRSSKFFRPPPETQPPVPSELHESSDQTASAASKENISRLRRILDAFRAFLKLITPWFVHLSTLPADMVSAPPTFSPIP